MRCCRALGIGRGRAKRERERWGTGAGDAGAVVRGINVDERELGWIYEVDKSCKETK
jgi:hypothetical protein